MIASRASICRNSLQEQVLLLDGLLSYVMLAGSLHLYRYGKNQHILLHGTRYWASAFSNTAECFMAWLQCSGGVTLLQQHKHDWP